MKTVTFYSVRKLENKPFSLSLLEKEAFSHLILFVHILWIIRTLSFEKSYRQTACNRAYPYRLVEYVLLEMVRATNYGKSYIKVVLVCMINRVFY